MIISPGRNYIFVHIPKTGGTSLALALEGRAMKDDILIGDTPKAKRRKARLKDVQARGRVWKHSTLSDIEGLVPPQMIQNALVVALVRNPWDRLVSLYHWLQDQTYDHPMVARAQSTSFDGFLYDANTQATISANPYASYLQGPQGLPPNLLWIRLEQFERDAAPLWAHLGFELSLPHLNRSHRPIAYQPFYNSDSSALVGRLCADDIKRHGYCF